MLRQHLEYKARKLDVTKTNNVVFDLINIKAQIRGRQDCPRWLLSQLDYIIRKTKDLAESLERFEDEVAGHFLILTKNHPQPKCKYSFHHKQT